MTNEEIKFQKGVLFFSKGQLSQARHAFEEILKFNSRHLDSYMFLGVIACQSKLWDRALSLFNKAIEINPSIDTLHNNRGNVLQELNLLEEALESYDKAILLRQTDELTYYNRGLVLQKLKKYEDALINFNKAIELNENYTKAYCDRGNVFQELRQFRDAILSYNAAIRLKTDYAEAYYNRGNALVEFAVDKQIDMYDDELSSFDGLQSIFLFKKLTWNDCLSGLKTVSILEEALASYDKSIELNHNNAQYYLARGVLLDRLRRREQALIDLNKGIELHPNNEKIFWVRGNILSNLSQYEDAILSYNQAIDLNQNYAEAYFARGHSLRFLLEIEAASQSFELAFKIKPTLDYLLGARQYLKMLMCDWSQYEVINSDIFKKLQNEEKVLPPFEGLFLIDNLNLQLKIAKIWTSDQSPSNPTLGKIAKLPRKEKIRIGYFSADFREHAVSYLTAELFEMHDKTRFETFGFYFGPPTTDQMHKRVSVAFNQFIDVRFRTAEEIARLCRDLEIDIAIDLTGNTANNRVDIFACRAAPIQLTYLGFLGTSGSDYFDYLIADKSIIPEESTKYYSEKIIYLPSYQVNDSKREISEKIFTKHDLNLPENSFVYCCFNSSYKINPDVFSSWMHILSKVDSSVLLIYAENAWVINNLRSEATKRGISSERLIFGQKMNRGEYLARYKSADLFLDTFPYNAGTTASDALWAGLPVLTRMGESFASRVASSLLNAIELPELITKSAIEYESLAIELANNPNKLKELKVKLARNRMSTQLFDTQRFTSNIETAYSLIYERYQQDLPPDHIYLT